MMTKRRSFLLVLGSLLVFGLTGCVSSKYKAAPKETPPAASLDLTEANSALSASLQSVIVFKGPGSWKQEAYWDEYIVTLANRTGAPLPVKAAVLFDLTNRPQLAGTDPWELEKVSQKKLNQFKSQGRLILLGAGYGALWFGSGLVGAGTLVGGGSVAVGMAGAGVFLGLPVLGVGTLVRSHLAEERIEQEFQRRRLVFPVTLAPGEALTGSLFFPVSPGPVRLVVLHGDKKPFDGVSMDLAPLAGLHLSPDPAKGPPAQSGDKPTTRPTIAP